ncbi:M9 family metallopeptidase [Vibrio anguillarum]|uniref:M9 family metallopeptidase n=1 Tax=Vibrio anguillarum TaxID=55601 RepID=UPI00188C18BE|nr:M9 family metallopeptidase [Vibrio anguillarum]MBF4257763.1 collagenase [Vibrio anguillarum]MBF4300369.1 collagenase [Vibrio anguillarum]MBF4397658.1 collagenase [Vibrio anguillarum]MBF4442077.1 collagenase [Vibrio anguillarum]
MRIAPVPSIHSPRPKPNALLLALSLAGLPSFSYALDACQFNDITQAQDPILAIKNAQPACYNSWFYTDSKAILGLYSENSIDSINRALALEVSQYQGTEAQAKSIANLGEFIRAAYYVRYGVKQDFGDYSEQLSNAIADTINQFMLSPYSLSLGREQVAAMSSLTLMVDNVKRLPSTMANFIVLLDAFNPQTAQDVQFVDGLNNLFRSMSGHASRDDFYQDIEAHPEYLETLYRFATEHDWALGTDADFILYNAVRETGRLLVSPYPNTKTRVIAILEKVLERYPLGGRSDKLWIAAVEMLSYYAPETLEALNLTQAKQQLEQRIMPNRHQCDGPAIIRSQGLTPQQAEQACEILNEKEADFHAVANTGFTPVADDLNQQVEVVVFDSNESYVSYSSFLFGNTTNNGGQYLEGNPADANNTARFVAYRYAQDEALSILNLEHEYVHYLDGRYNQYGSFSLNLSEGHIVWWLEGFAEYMHYKKGYQAAIDLIAEKKLSLTQVLATIYQNDTNQIYRWGYLAVRFMLENHPNEVDQLLALSRSGDFKAWAEQVKRIGKSLDSEFSTWLDTLTTGSGNPEDPTVPPIQPEDTMNYLALGQSVTLSGEQYSEQLYYIDVPDNVSELSINISGDGDADLYLSYEKIAHYYDYQITNFELHSNETIALEKQANGTVLPGRYYFSITGREAYQRVELNTKVSYAITDNTQKPSDDLAPVVLENRQPMTLDIHQTRYAAIYVPEGMSSVKVWLQPIDKMAAHNVDLYAASENWPTLTHFDQASKRADSYEYIELPVTQAGYVHFMLNAPQANSQVELYATYE